MRFWKFIYWTTGAEYETTEFYIGEPDFRKYQRAIIEGKELLVMEDRVIKVKMVKEIVPADEDVKDYLKMGITLKQLGLKELPKLEEAKKEQLNEGQKRLAEMKLKAGIKKFVDYDQ